MTQKQSYEKKLQAQLDEWDAEIDRLKAKAKQLEADTQIDYYQKIDDLRAKQKAANAKLSELKHASDDAWEDLKSGIDSAWKTLGNAVNSASSRFQ